MDRTKLKSMLAAYRAGLVAEEALIDELERLPYEDLGFARIDHHRSLRLGFPEVIFGAGKTAEQIRVLFEKLAAQNPNVLVTRTDESVFEEVQSVMPEARYHTAARAISLQRDTERRGKGVISVVCAGTSDIAVAEEAAVTCEVMGNEVTKTFDAGVAGIHRLLGSLEELRKSRVVVCAAGMEGALPSVVGGLVSVPVIAVPTSVGYGASFHGIAALLGMLNSCASNVTVVNIDNGFGAGFVASLINRL